MPLVPIYQTGRRKNHLNETPCILCICYLVLRWVHQQDAQEAQDHRRLPHLRLPHRGDSGTPRGIFLNMGFKPTPVFLQTVLSLVHIINLSNIHPLRVRFYWKPGFLMKTPALGLKPVQWFRNVPSGLISGSFN